MAYFGAGNDYNYFWSAGRAALDGQNPYADPHFVNPPPSVPLYALLALWPRSIGAYAWAALNAIAAAMLIFEVHRLFKAQAKPAAFELPSAVLQGLALVTALSLPTHFCIGSGQVSPLMTLCLVLAVAGHAEGRPISAGLAYALATIKAHTALPFLLMFFRPWKWRFWITAGAGVAVLSLAFPGPSHIVEWVRCELGNLAILSQPGAVNDYTFTSSQYFHLIGFDLLYYALGIHDRGLVRLFQMATLALLGAWLAWEILWRQRWPRSLGSAMAACYAMLFLYHRGYDAGILAIPLVYAVAQLRATAKRVRVCFIAVMVAILLVWYAHPILNVLLVRLAERIHSDFVTRSVIAIFIPLQTWLILGSMFLLQTGYLMARLQEGRPLSCPGGEGAPRIEPAVPIVTG
jgi:hypothetical protein